MPRFKSLFALLAIVASLAGIVPGNTKSANAQTDQRCFPETGYCISGSIRSYWERNGGLPVFGFPIGPQVEEFVEGIYIPVQWFERDRLEIQNSGSVTAGRLGARLLEVRGTPWQPGNDPSCPTPAGGTHLCFPETGHRLGGAFQRYWESNGGLERFGFPITGELRETLNGRTYIVQYFERRRMELHPELGEGVVLLGLLGTQCKARDC